MAITKFIKACNGVLSEPFECSTYIRLSILAAWSPAGIVLNASNTDTAGLLPLGEWVNVFSML
jgi:hypothetical protein